MPANCPIKYTLLNGHPSESIKALLMRYPDQVNHGAVNSNETATVARGTFCAVLNFGHITVILDISKCLWITLENDTGNNERSCKHGNFFEQ
jgi:hypothetical protein